MDLRQLATKFPKLWHVTFAGGWAGIHRNRLLRAVDVDPTHAASIRPEPQVVQWDHGGAIVLRDQVRSRTDPPASLDGVSPSQWWRLINGRVYFFPREADAERLVTAYLSKRRPQEVIKFRTTPALEDVATSVEVATVNAGVFPRHSGPSRGQATFVPLGQFPHTQVSAMEITVIERVPVRSRAVISVVRWDPDGARTRLFP